MSNEIQDLGALELLIATLSLPASSKVPSPADGRATMQEYDRYFRIVREHPDLLKWSRTCFDLFGLQLADLPASTLDWKERCQILEGMLVIHRLTLEKWIQLGEAGKEAREL